MSKTWVISDTHFGHANMLSFLGDDGKRFRPFDSVEELDELMIERWNQKVKAKDRIYHLGDICMKRRFMDYMSRLNGRKVLVRGNHDIFKLKDYLPYFEDIRAYKIMPGCGIIMSHIPIHERQMCGRFQLNVHGHLHEKTIDDKRYLNVCVEHTDWSPIDLEEIISYKEAAE